MAGAPNGLPCIVAGAFQDDAVTTYPLPSPAALPTPAPTPARRLAALATMMSLAAVIAACGGGGGDDDAPAPAPAPAPAGGPFTISGKAVFESIPARAGVGLDYAATVDKPVRGATVQLLGAGGAVLTTTTTDAAGNYSVVLPASQAVTVRVRAEIKRSGTTDGDRDFTVLDNTSGNALYVLDSAAFTPTADATQNLRAASGWGGTGYTGTRAAAPFAILDVVYDAQAKIASVASAVNLPTLKLYWSRNNKTVRDANDDLSTGNIGTSFFTVTSTGRSLYILGQEDVDTDEYDTHVVAHEFGHYLQSALSRDDSIGGVHGGGDKLDMRVAFSEGWGNAWSGIALADPVYVDSQQTRQASGFSLNVATAPGASDRGWYSESSAQYLIWTTNSNVGFGPVYTAFTALRSSPAFSSLYSFADRVKAASAANAAAITALWAGQDIVAQDAFGTGETNSGGVPGTLPVYKTHTAALGAAQNYCGSKSADPDSDGNRLGEAVFVRFAVSGTHTLTLARTAPATVGSADPDFMLVKSDGSSVEARSGQVDLETLANTSLPTGTHSAALTDYNFRSSASGNTRCFDFKVN